MRTKEMALPLKAFYRAVFGNKTARVNIVHKLYIPKLKAPLLSHFTPYL